MVVFCTHHLSNLEQCLRVLLGWTWYYRKRPVICNLLPCSTSGKNFTLDIRYFQTYIFQQQDIQEKARQEAIRVFGDDPVDILPTVEQTKELDYINMVIKEVSRLMLITYPKQHILTGISQNLRINGPAISVVARYAAEDTELGGVFIPKGTRMVLDIYGLHHNPKVWKDPSKFDPDRFLPGGEAEQLARQGMAWIPFSNGARQCIGMNFSLAEQRVLLPFLRKLSSMQNG